MLPSPSDDPAAANSDCWETDLLLVRSLHPWLPPTPSFLPPPRALPLPHLHSCTAATHIHRYKHTSTFEGRSSLLSIHYHRRQPAHPPTHPSWDSKDPWRTPHNSPSNTRLDALSSPLPTPSSPADSQITKLLMAPPTPPPLPPLILLTPLISSRFPALFLPSRPFPVMSAAPLVTSLIARRRVCHPPPPLIYVEHNN